MTEWPCRVWKLYQPRCRLCGWSGEITGDPVQAADDAAGHRRELEHISRLFGHRGSWRMREAAK